MIPLQTLSQYAEVLGTNTHLKELHMANVRLTDKIAKVIFVSFVQASIFLENIYRSYPPYSIGHTKKGCSMKEKYRNATKNNHIQSEHSYYHNINTISY